MAVVVYSELSRDARVRKAIDVALEEGCRVHCFSLKEQGRRYKGEEIKYVNTGVNQYRGDSKVKYLVSYIAFFLSVLVRLSISGLRNNYKIIHVHNMPDFLVFCSIIPKIRGAKIILDIHDSMPKVFVEKFKKGLVSSFTKSVLKFQERMSAAFADSVITVHEPYKQEVISQNGIPLDKIAVIKNLPDERVFQPIQYKLEEDDILQLVFHGTIAERYGLRTVISGLKIVSDAGLNFRFNVYGKGDDRTFLEELVQQLDLSEKVIFHGLVPLDMIPSKIGNSHLGIASLDGLEDGLSVKLLEYVGMAIPVITTNNHVIEYYFGKNELFLYEKKNAKDFAEKVMSLINNKSLLKNQSKLLIEVRNRFLWSKEKELLRKIYSDE
ncbi:MAG: glycosyltransferase family 4 protein [Ekhidna sp.]